MSDVFSQVQAMFDPEDFCRRNFPTIEGRYVYFCDGRILIEVEYAGQPLEKRFERDESGQWWFYFREKEPVKREAIDYPSKLRGIDYTRTHDIPFIPVPSGISDLGTVQGDCDECCMGEVECNLGHTHECETCDGTGVAESVPESLYDGIKVDQVLLAGRYLWMLSKLPGIKLGPCLDPSKPVGFTFDGGRGVIMGMKEAD